MMIYSLASVQGRSDMPTENNIRIVPKLVCGCKLCPFQFILDTMFRCDFFCSTYEKMSELFYLHQAKTIMENPSY